MRLLLVLLLLVVCSPLYAQTEVSSQIHDIDMGLANEEPLIFLASGQVVKLPKGNKAAFAQLREAIKLKTWFHFTLNADREIISMVELPFVARSPQAVPKLFETPEAFTPSILKDLDQARGMFYEARANAKEESQCFNRAHVWSYEWRTKRNLYSSKAWLFFTRKFIRKYKFEWWFHVAPMIHVVVDNEVKEKVMDIKYAKGPLKLKQWTDIFLRDSANCPVVEKYSDYANFPESGSCFLMKSSMYYYQPVDLEQEELSGTGKTKWLEPEVKQAYLDAFDVRLGENNE